MNHLFITKGGELMSLIQVREKAQITIPSKIRKALDIKEGDYLEAEVEDNKIVFIPKVLIDKTEPVTLSKKGEEMLKEALGDVKKGRVKKFKNVEELIDDLHK
jgi:AbrB family looped-hinge helix DNA binding protein